MLAGSETVGWLVGVWVARIRTIRSVLWQIDGLWTNLWLGVSIDKVGKEPSVVVKLNAHDTVKRHSNYRFNFINQDPK